LEGTAETGICMVVFGVGSRGRARGVVRKGNGTLDGASARARSVERGERAIRSPQEAMTHIAVVSVVSRDGACRVNATVAEGALRKRSCACTRSIKHSETAVSSAHVGVNHI